MITPITKRPSVVTGSGGGGSKGGSAGGSTIAQNTLQSNTIAQIIEMLGEGPIEGLINGAQSIYFNETPLQNADGSYNFGGLFTYDSTTGNYDQVATGTTLGADDQWLSGVSYETTTGLPDQAVLQGYASSSTTTSVNEQIQNSIGPIVRTIEDTNTTSVLVCIGIPTFDARPSTGDLNSASVAWQIAVAPYGGEYVTAATISIANQKCTSLYLQQTSVVLPPGGAPWNIQVTRLSADELTDINISNQTWWESYTEVVAGQFMYPNTALVALSINSEFFGSTIPTRGYMVKGLICDIPSNYDPVARTYTGVWDGTFQQAWHNNPVWVLYALLTNPRWGLGEFIDASIVDKWGLYAISQYCDELVPSGFLDTDGHVIYEPRFVYNGVINNRAEAYKVLQDVCSAFRGMGFWSLGQFFASADMPTDPITTVAPANVIGGHFNYSGTAMKSRHSVAAVSWNDPQDFYRPAIELVQNNAMIQLFGWRQVDIAAPGCTSRGQARRYGKWLLAVEENETETVEFTMSWDSYILESGTTLRPGNIIFVADPRKTGNVRIGGQLQTITSTSELTIDAPFVPTAGDSYTLTVAQPDGTIETQPIGSFDSTNTILTMATPFAQTPQVGAMWVIQGTDVNPRQYRVLAVEEQDKHLFKITALFYDPSIYALVEDNISIAPPTYVRPNNVMQPPTAASAVESNYFINGAPQSRVTLSWTQPSSSIAVSYNITATGPGGSVNFGSTNLVSIDLFNITPGAWVFYIAAVSASGLISINLPCAVTVQGWLAVTVPTTEDLGLVGGGTTFTGIAPTIVWTNTFPSGTPAYPIVNMVRVYDSSGTLLRTETVTGLTYTYSFADNVNDGGPRRSLIFTVTAVSLLGVEQATPATITVTNPQLAAIAPTVASISVAVNVSWTETASDYAGAMVWLSPTSGFDPSTTTPSWSGTGSTVEINETATGTFYVVLAVYDVFGTDGLNYSAEVPIVCTGLSLSGFTTQLEDLITAQSLAIQQSIQQTQGVIATAASEQDAANWLADYNIKTVLQANYQSLTNAIVTSTSLAEANATSAVASLTTSVTASFAATNANVTETLTAVAGINGALAAAWTVTTDVNGYISGISLYNSGTSSEIVLITDDFEIASPAHLLGTPATVTISIATPAVVSWTAHGLSAGQQVQFSTTGALPAGLVAATWYYVIAAGLTANTFEVSATSGGAAINTTGTQSGVQTCTPAGGGAPIPVFEISTVNGVPQLALHGNLIADGSITASTIAAGAITAGSLAVGAVNATNIIVDDIIVTGHLQADTATAVAYATAASVVTSGTTTTLCTLAYTAYVGQLLLDCSFDVPSIGEVAINALSIQLQLYFDGTLVRTVVGVPIAVAIFGGGNNECATTGFGSLICPHYVDTTPGAHTITLVAYISSGAGYTATNAQIRVMESMR